jgi:glyoxalase family protein
MSNGPIQGIHHITGAVQSAQRDLQFYTEVLGLRLIKKTVNQDNPTGWHFFYGDHVGNAGTIMTNIIIPDGTPIPRCVDGRGTIDALSYSISADSLDYWRERLTKSGYACDDRPKRFGDSVLHFRDPDGVSSELIGCADARVPGLSGDVPTEHQIRGFHGATLISRLPDLTKEFFTTLMGFQVVGEEDGRTRLAVAEGGPGQFIDLLDVTDGPWGRFGLGAIHHIAFTVPSLEVLEMMWKILSGSGLIVTDARDRGWFHSMYFTEPGGINLELSNMQPGWTVDEEIESLGTIISLPERLEPQRSEIESGLPDINF